MKENICRKFAGPLPWIHRKAHKFLNYTLETASKSPITFYSQYMSWTDTQFSFQYNTVKQFLKIHTVDFPEISTLSNLIYRTKHQASTGIGQHPLGTKFCYQYKCEQHTHAFLQGTPAFHLQNRLQETQAKDTECDLLLTKSIQYFPFTVIRFKFGLWLFFLLFFLKIILSLFK